MKKRLISLLLCLVLCMSLLPMAVLAEDIEPLAVENDEAMPEPTAEPTAEPEPTEEPEVTAEPTAIPEATSTPEPIATPEVTAEPEVTPEPTTAPEPTAELEVQPLSLDGAATGTSLQTELSKEYALGGGTFYLSDNLTISKTIKIARGNPVTIDLNGKTLTMNANNNIFSVESDGQLSIIGDGTITFQSGNSAYGVYVADGGLFTMTGGTISNCSTGIYICDSESSSMSSAFVMSGGTISNCTSTGSYQAGGVYVGKNRKFTMTAGTILGCSSTGGSSAGGVYVGDNGEFNMSGGQINGSGSTVKNEKGVCISATGSYSGGGVYVGNGGKFTMSAGNNENTQILGCNASGSNSGGGVYVSSGGEFTMSGGTLHGCGAKVLDESVQAAGGVYNKGIFTMNKGSFVFCHFHVQSDTGFVAAIGSCAAGGVVNEGTFTISNASNLAKSVISQSYVYACYSGIKNPYVKGLANAKNATVNAYGGMIDGIFNEGTIRNTDGGDGTIFQVFDDTLNGNEFAYSQHTNTPDGKISGGYFEGKVNNYGEISGGTFAASRSGITGRVSNAETISGGTFNGEVDNASGTISGGTFNGDVDNQIGTISGGTFTDTVTNHEKDGIVSGGTFTGAARTNVCQISFDLDGGTGTTPATQWRYKAAAEAPEGADPTKRGYKFLGWYNGDTRFDFTSTVTSATDITLKAKWLELPEAAVTAPTAKTGLEYNGSAQTLINAGSSTNGTMKYSLAQNGTYTTELPTATNAETYTVWFYAEGDGTTTSDSDKKSVSVTIDPKSIGNEGVTVVDPTYSGSEQSPTVTVTDTALSKELAKNTDYTIAAGSSGTGVSGATSATNVGNYNLVVKGKDNYTGSVTRTWSIQPKSITPQSLTAKNKIYNGNTDAEIENVSFHDLAPGETLTMGTDYTVSNAKFVDANAGDNKTVTATVTLNNTARAKNYKLASNAVNGTASITKKSITAVITVADKQYDGKTAASVSAALNTSDLISGDSITITGLTGTFAGVQVGSGISVAVDSSGVVISGAENYNVTIPATASGAIVNGWHPAKNTEYTATEPNENGWLKDSLTITAGLGYELSLTNTADGTWSSTLTGSTEGADSKLEFYVRNVTTGAISEKATENYKLDKNTEASETTGTIQFVGRQSWQEFVSHITFGLFYKDEVTVQATAEDKLSGVDTIEYAASDKALTLEQVKSVSAWTDMPTDGVGVTLEDAKKFVYFLRITDKAGNTTYLSTDGAEYDTAPPVISGIENGASYHTTRSVTVSDRNLLSITLNGEAATLEDGKLSLTGDVDAVYTIRAVDKAGNAAEYTVMMKKISALTEPVKDITVDNATSQDRGNIDSVLDGIDNELENEDMTDAERRTLNDERDRIEDALDRLDDAKAATEDKSITDTDDIDKDNAKSTDKQKLEDAKDAIEKALEDYGGNLTEGEKQELSDKLDRIEDALDRLEDAKAASEDKSITDTDDIDKDNAKSSDKQKLEDAKDAIEKTLEDYDANLTDAEKQSLNDKLDRIEDALAAIEAAEKAAKAVRTGDEALPILWLALALSAALALGYTARRKKN